MSKEDIISSGILEQYALGGLNESERSQIEQLLVSDADIRAELNRIEATLEEIAFRSAVTPSAQIREKIINKAKESSSVEPDKTGVIESPHHTKRPALLWQWLTAACFAAFVITGFLAYNLKKKLDETEIQLDVALQDKRVLADQMQQVKHELKQNQIAGFNKVDLKGTENAPNAVASILWNQQLEEVYLTFQELPKLDNSSQYQLWVIKDGQPVDMGVFDYATAAQRLVKMKKTNSAQAFAITIEPKGGSATPTLEKMVVIGNVEETSKG